MSSVGVPVKKAKKSAFSCDPCRRRKVKCGGEQPRCERCIKRQDECVYHLNPTLSYTEKLEARVRELEKSLRMSKKQSQLSDEGSPMSQTSPRNLAPHPTLNPESRTSTSFQGLKRDNKGGITYHGATSLFNLPSASSARQVDDGATEIMTPLDENERRKERLVESAWQQRALENLSEIPEPFQFILQTHWCWIQPMFNFVYRPAFTRDMEVMGPYYSHTLMNAMLSHSVRWCKKDPKIREQLQPYDDGDLFYRQARTLLFEDITAGHAKVPTVQTLLLLSAQECSNGNRTQAWLYSGMAFRLIEDMGIFIDGQKYAGSVTLSDEDIEIRNRLFWSCYFWDKIICLYLGRSPTLQHSNVSPPQIMMDDSAENDLWTPHGLKYPESLRYPPTQAHSTSCFMKMCQLSVIFNQILINMYDPVQQQTEGKIQSCLETEGEALRAWWNDLPVFLRIDPHDLPICSPPSHIVVLNCLFHVFKILLYRPMLCHRSNNQRSEASHLVECVSSATTIIAIFDLYCRTFGVDYCILSLSYSVYTAASIFLLQIQAAPNGNDEALERLKVCIAALENVKISNPVIGGASALIVEALAKSGYEMPRPTPTQEPELTLGEPFLFPQNIEMSTYNTTASLFHANSSFETSHESYHIPPLYNFDPDSFEVSSETLAAFSALEPVDPTFGDTQDWFH